MLTSEMFDDIWQHRDGERVGACNPDLARCRIGQKLDFPNPLFQFIKRRLATPHQCLAVGGRNDSLRASIQEAHAQRMLQVGDDFRDGRCGHVELGSGLSHAALPHHREKHEEVTQPQATADLMFPLDDARHKAGT